MANRTSRNTQRRRGRTVQKRSSMLPLYLGIGLIAIIGVIIFMVTRTSDSGGDVDIGTARTINAPVGQTAQGFWYMGSPDAPVKVVEYADYQCPGCAAMEQSIHNSDFVQKYVESGQVQFIYHEFPLINIHESAQLSAEIARCGGDQGKFWPVHDALFATQDQWAGKGNARAVLLSAASKAGADRGQIEACLAAGTHTKAVETAGQNANQAGVSSTPTVYVNGNVATLTSDYAQSLSAAVDAALTD